MNRMTIPCPRCDYDDSDLLDLIRDDVTGFAVGHRVRCRGCEHVWTDLTRLLDRAQPAGPWSAPALVGQRLR